MSSLVDSGMIFKEGAIRKVLCNVWSYWTGIFLIFQKCIKPNIISWTFHQKMSQILIKCWTQRHILY